VQGRKLSIVHLIDASSILQSKDYEFSRATVEALWDADARPCRRSRTQTGAMPAEPSAEYASTISHSNFLCRKDPDDR
jgi:hypothetical protein